MIEGSLPWTFVYINLNSTILNVATGGIMNTNISCIFNHGDFTTLGKNERKRKVIVCLREKVARKISAKGLKDGSTINALVEDLSVVTHIV